MSLTDLTVACLNLRWIASKQVADPHQWASWIERQTRKRITRERAEGLLMDHSLELGEAEVLAGLGNVDAEEFQSAPLYLREYSILAGNLKYLLGYIPHGQKKEAAKSIGITAEQLSRWGKGDAQPHAANLRALLKYHGADPDIDLAREPIFLSMEPMSVFAQRSWLKQRVEELPADEFNRIFPALRRIFRHDERP